MSDGNGNTGSAESVASAAPEAAGPDESLTAAVETADDESGGDAAQANDAALTDEATGASAKAAPTVPPAPAPNLSPLMIARAVRAGLEDDEIGQFASDAELERIVGALERRAPKKDSAPAAVGEGLQADDIPDLPGEDYGEGLQKGWSVMKGTVKALVGELRAIRQAMQEGDLRQQIEWFDSQLGSLEDAEGILGKGSGYDLQDRNHITSRDRLYQAFLKLSGGRRNSAALKQAFNGLFAAELDKAKKAKLATHLHAQKAQFTQPPTQRASEALKEGRERAIEAVTQKLAARGQKRKG